jgi:hypothetical protein
LVIKRDGARAARRGRGRVAAKGQEVVVRHLRAAVEDEQRQAARRSRRRERAMENVLTVQLRDAQRTVA